MLNQKNITNKENCSPAGIIAVPDFIIDCKKNPAKYKPDVWLNNLIDFSQVKEESLCITFLKCCHTIIANELFPINIAINKHHKELAELTMRSAHIDYDDGEQEEKYVI